ncbi:hypothetical protein Poli38472_007053 [Pythium oligandrum]|uniref:Uncharacterized protein n=1 Tax=Pythium oligandrum TaxID=41045 RepID=A0A8K1C9I2_PYTOL|nr:hypothetical protein Poli38472_007053 [Pythium oligandrum]|eukprot:TMW58908.1 hypothetical protein Poli38472_007053 [Pythium oligandrum]
MAPTTKLAHIEESNSPGSRRLMEQEVDETESIKHNEFSGTTLDFPTDTPFQYEYAMEKFYVRACYGRYYDVILEMFEETGTKRKRGVTVTGTPGKSMFMAYFFLRYLFEYDNSTVILASYDGDSELTRVLVWKDGQVKDSFRGNVLRLEGTYAQCPHAHVLLDGPPKFGPEHQQYVVFTSPNEK